VAVPLIQRGRETTFSLGDLTTRLHICQECGHIFFFPVPAEEALKAYYNGPWNAGANFGIEDSYLQWVEQFEGYLPQRTFVETLLRLRKQYFATDQPVVVHDASCGFGALVEKLNMLGFDASGSDIDGEAIGAARARGNTRVFQCHFEGLTKIIPEGADIITTYHSVEHFINPLEFFRTVKSVLRPGGLFVVAVPNGAYLPARMDHFSKFDWCMFPGHLHYFTPYSAEVLMGRAGLRLLEAFSYDWGQTQADWCFRTATGLTSAQLIAPDKLLESLSENALTRELRLIAINDREAPIEATRFQNKCMGFTSHEDEVRAAPTPCEKIAASRSRMTIGKLLRRAFRHPVESAN